MGWQVKGLAQNGTEQALNTLNFEVWPFSLPFKRLSGYGFSRVCHMVSFLVKAERWVGSREVLLQGSADHLDSSVLRVALWSLRSSWL